MPFSLAEKLFYGILGNRFFRNLDGEGAGCRGLHPMMRSKALVRASGASLTESCIAAAERARGGNAVLSKDRGRKSFLIARCESFGCPVSGSWRLELLF